MKKIICLLLAITMMMSMSLCLVSCNDDNGDGGEENNNPGGDQTPEKVTYTVTVTDEDGNPIKGVEVLFSPEGGVPFPKSTDVAGQVSYKNAKKVVATVTEIPEGYDYDKLGSAQEFADDGTLSVVLTRVGDGDPFVIKVVDQDGNPIAGVTVQMCDKAGLCKPGGETDAEGKYYYDYTKGEFRAQITGGNIPDGYTVADPTAYYDFIDGVATIVLTKIAD